MLKDVHLEVRRGERVVICGPSGSGKSTLIRCLNQLEEHQQGSIQVDGAEVSRTMRNIATIRSEIGMVFKVSICFHISRRWKTAALAR